MENTIKVSVIIPVFNMEKYLCQCINSVLNQTLQEIELVCINDGSKDRSLEILEEYKKNNSKIRIINQENQGVGTARNKGILAAKGEYIVFMDPDDYYLDNYVLEELYQAAKQHNVLVCGGSLSEDHNNGKWIRKEFLGVYTKYTFEKEGYILYKDYQFDYGFYRFMYKRNFLLERKLFFPKYIRFQDPPFFVKTMIEAKGFYALPRITYCYRYGHQNLKWDENRINAVLHGFIDNLTYSSRAELKELHMLTIDRMLREYKDKIILGLNMNSKSVMNLLLEADKHINKEYIKDTVYKEGIVNLLFEWKIDSEEKKNLEIENIKESTTFKVGKCIMTLPIAIKKRMTRK